ncbi:MAG TPA: VCBS repeat-containing protein [Thermoanaerobaculia bacterium]|nr:VCBS repeat-containing protein [Thermoanaerobaculia bacterium]
MRFPRPPINWPEITSDWVWVTTAKQLEDALQQGLDGTLKGPIIVAANIELTGKRRLTLSSNVQLIGWRGPLGRRPQLWTRTPSFKDPVTEKDLGYSLFEVWGNGVRVGGIHFWGPAKTDINRSSSQAPVSAITVFQHKVTKGDSEETDLEKSSGLSVVIADCEFNEWTDSGVLAMSFPECHVKSPEQWNAADCPLPEEEEKLRVERSYFHHIAKNRHGYGVGVNGGTYAVIEGNVFDFNRHAVASDGHAKCGYTARFNYVLQGGYREGGVDTPVLGTVGSYYNQHFDVHGSDDDSDGGWAGESFEIAFNTIRGEQSYHAGLSTRPALSLRGTPETSLHFSNNVLVHDNHDDALSFKGGVPGRDVLGELIGTGQYVSSGNRYDTDYSTELATGDFNGDRLTDVFVATGTAWFFSRGGQQPWEYLQASRFRTRDLGFADVDNDGVTDVLWRLAGGAIEYSKSGTGYPAPLTFVPVSMAELRFGDFNGDRKTDLFFTQAGQWNLWYGPAGPWTPTLGADRPVTELLFGEFDDVRGTDLAAALLNEWVVSSGAVVAWAHLNDRLATSFANAVVADFDGNGRSDIAWSDGNRWVYSRDGRDPLVTFRQDDPGPDYPPLKSLLIGQFGGDAGAEVVAFNRHPFFTITGARLVIWRGLGSGDAFSNLSDQNMR